MRSKFEILNEFLIYPTADDIDGEFATDVSGKIENAMDEYAREQTLATLGWLIKKDFGYLNPKRVKEQSEKLFNQFLQETKQDK